MPEDDLDRRGPAPRLQQPDVVVILCSTYDAGDLPREVATSGARAYLNKEHLGADTLRKLWDHRDSEEFHFGVVGAPASASPRGTEPRPTTALPTWSPSSTVPPIAPSRSRMFTKPWPPLRLGRVESGPVIGNREEQAARLPPRAAPSTVAPGACLPAFWSASRQQK